MAASICWIEDNLEFLEPLIEPLKEAGHRFTIFRTVEEVLENLEALRSVDLILLDIILDGRVSGYAGLDLLKELRRDEDISCPIVALTVVTRESLSSELQDLADGVIIKPLRPSQLKEKVEQILQAHTPDYKKG